jgi:lysozyme family protein
VTGDWERAIAFVLKMEGGAEVENDPLDRGGQTKFGISKAAFPALDVKNLTLDQAKDIYRRAYWNEVHGDELPWPFSAAVFDAAVNQGPGIARRMLQVALRVEVDGNVGPKTVAAAHAAGEDVVRRFLVLRLVRYTQTCVDRPDQMHWAANWANRVLRLADLCFGRPS